MMTGGEEGKAHSLARFLQALERRARLGNRFGAPWVAASPDTAKQHEQQQAHQHAPAHKPLPWPQPLSIVVEDFATSTHRRACNSVLVGPLTLS